jgi:hypothetical protein
MKRFLIPAALLIGFVLFAQTKFADGPVIPVLTVGTLPSASGASGKWFAVSDGASTCDTTTGSGSTLVLATSTGSAWVAPNCGGGSSAYLTHSVTLSATQIDALDGAPQAIVAAPGSGILIVPLDLSVVNAYDGVAFSCSGNLLFGYSASLTDAANSSPTILTYPSAKGVQTFGAARINPLDSNNTNQLATSGLVNQGFYVGMSTANCTGGTGATVTFTLGYRLITP